MSDVVLALDLATASGWAHGPVGGKPYMGPIEFEGKAFEEKTAHLIRWLPGIIKLVQPRMVVIEKPLDVAVLGRIGATFDTVILLYTLAGVAKTIAHMRSVPIVKFIGVQDVRQHFVGQRTFKESKHPITGKKISSRQNAKAAVINRCNLLGWTVQNDDVADAAATWHWGCCQLDRRLAAQTTPLFGGAR